MTASLTCGNAAALQQAATVEVQRVMNVALSLPAGTWPRGAVGTRYRGLVRFHVPRTSGEPDGGTALPPSGLISRACMPGFFRMPTSTGIMGRSSSVTTSFIDSIIPVIPPADDEVAARPIAPRTMEPLR